MYLIRPVVIITIASAASTIMATSQLTATSRTLLLIHLLYSFSALPHGKFMAVGARLSTLIFRLVAHRESSVAVAARAGITRWFTNSRIRSPIVDRYPVLPV